MYKFGNVSHAGHVVWQRSSKRRVNRPLIPHSFLALFVSRLFNSEEVLSDSSVHLHSQQEQSADWSTWFALKRLDSI